MKKLSLLVFAALAALLYSTPALSQNKTKVKNIDLPVPNAEICLGNSITPRVTFTNVWFEQVNIKAQLLIVNAVTGVQVYGDTVEQMNVASGTDVTVTFNTFVTNANILSQIGRLEVIAIGPAMNSSNVIIGDALPEDDTMRSVMFGVRRMGQPLRDPSNDYSVVKGLAIPDHHKWLTLGATVMEGDSTTFDPPSPRDPGTGYGTRKLHSPVIRLDRYDHAGVLYSGTANGDILSSMPINLNGVTKAMLTFDYHRSSKRTYSSRYDSSVLHGLESTVLNANGSVHRKGDSLILEFKKPNEPACQPSANAWTQIAAIDGAKDIEFQRFAIPIESLNNASTNYFKDDFRFRLRLKAKADAPLYTDALDDKDACFIDNIQVLSAIKPEVRINWVRVVSPYTEVPASQAIYPVFVKLTNDGPGNTSDSLPIVVEILGPDGKAKYFERHLVSLPKQGKDTIVRLPDYDATGTLISTGRECTVHAWIGYSGFDSYAYDDYAYSSFFINAESQASLTHEFSYDDAGIVAQSNVGNDMPVFTKLQGQGVGFNGNTGSYAMRIKLVKSDTLYGISAYFASANASNEDIRLSVYEGSDTSNIPGSRVNISGYSATHNDVRRGDMFNRFWPYYFAKPIPLKGVTDSTDGIYWVSVSQLSLDNMTLGADMSRAGFDHTVYTSSGPNKASFLHRSKYGTQYSATQNSGNISNAFAFESTAGSNNWRSLQPTEIFTAAGWPWAWKGNFAYTPMIRAMFGRRTLLPVEFVQPLKATDEGNAALLTWTTATESNNSGFIVQRLTHDDDWSRVGFVPSRTANSSSPRAYSFVDKGLSAGNYAYRLTQVDLDGTQAISNTAEVRVTGDAKLLSNFTPNPFNPGAGSSTLSLDPSLGEVRVTVINSLGQTVRTLTASDLLTFDGKDAAGELLPTGSYLVRLQSGTASETRRISILR